MILSACIMSSTAESVPLLKMRMYSLEGKIFPSDSSEHGPLGPSTISIPTCKNSKPFQREPHSEAHDEESLKTRNTCWISHGRIVGGTSCAKLSNGRDDGGSCRGDGFSSLGNVDQRACCQSRMVNIPTVWSVAFARNVDPPGRHRTPVCLGVGGRARLSADQH